MIQRRVTSGCLASPWLVGGSRGTSLIAKDLPENPINTFHSAWVGLLSFHGHMTTLSEGQLIGFLFSNWIDALHLQPRVNGLSAV